MNAVWPSPKKNIDLKCSRKGAEKDIWTLQGGRIAGWGNTAQ
jgi:hypothetical protein